MTDAMPPPLGTPPPADPPPAINVPGFALTWGKVATICGTIVVTVGVAYWGLISNIYGHLDKNIDRLQTSVDAVNDKYSSAAKDAGALQVVLSQAPELRANIQTTHDAVVRIEARLDGIDKSLSSVGSSVDNLKSLNDKLRGSVEVTNSMLAQAIKATGPK